MRTRLLVVLITLVAWVVGFTCAVPSFAHACCKGMASSQKMAPMAACCQVQPIAQGQSKALSNGSAGDDTASAGIPLHRLSFLPLVVSESQSLLATRYVPDQSGRHLELSVLLN
ncbi:MAG TPA: hypothetical protein V6C52_11690 [Coleofasciculaceae cyanobacterium]|jgi:hypothetical protein